VSFLQHVGQIEQVPIFESPLMGRGYGSAGIALPGIGIIVGTGVYSHRLDTMAVYHEYGHFLQAKQMGKVIFYLCIGIPSLWSASTPHRRHRHQDFWTETWCNHLSRLHFDQVKWPMNRFPPKAPSNRMIYWLSLLK